MGFLDVGSPQERFGKAQIPPASKFAQLQDTVNTMLSNTDTVGLAEWGMLKEKSFFDDSAPMGEQDIENAESDVPGLTIPKGTRVDTGRSLTNLQITKNFQKFVADDPRDNTAVSWLGKAIGGAGYVGDPVDNLIALPLTAGASLAVKAFLPEFLSLTRLLPDALKPFVEAGQAGGVYGGGINLLSGEVQAARKKEETGIETLQSTIVKNAVERVPWNVGAGVGLYGVGRIIAKGVGLVGAGLRKANGTDVLQSAQTPVEGQTLQDVVDQRKAQVAQDKEALQAKVSAIRENHAEGAEAVAPNGAQTVDKMVGATKEAVTEAQTKFPDDKKLASLDEQTDTINESNQPHSVKMQALSGVSEELSNFSLAHDKVAGEEVKGANDILTEYQNQVATAMPNKDPDSIENILNNFRMTTPEDYNRFKNIGLAQMEAGRDVDVEPYINDAVANNSEKLVNRLEEAGHDREQILHSTLDSLEVVKEDQASLQDSMDSLSKRIEKVPEGSEKLKSALQGRLEGFKKLSDTKSDQIAVHEVLAAALSNEFKLTPKDAVKNFLMDQISRDAEFKGGYEALQNEFIGRDRIESLEDEPKAFTEEGKEEESIIAQRKSLAPKMLEDAFKCLLGN